VIRRLAHGTRSSSPHQFPHPLLDRERVAKDWQDRAVLASAGGLLRKLEQLSSTG
jgi:hypothetical protein